MMLKEPVSDSVVRRLPRYYRYLSELERAGASSSSGTLYSGTRCTGGCG